jgi:Uma2 family endonuclease
MAQVEAGIARPDRDDTCYVADLAVTCTPPGREDQLIADPVLIVEILSPTTAMYDRQTKVSDYHRIPSVQEILLVDSTSMFAEVLRREGDRWITEIVRGPQGVLSLSSIAPTVSMSDLYEGIDLPEPTAAISPTR